MSKSCRLLAFLSPITILVVYSWVGEVASMEYGLGNPFGLGPWQRFPFGLPPAPPYFQQLYFPNWGFQSSFFPQLPAIIVSQVEQTIVEEEAMDYLIDATSLDPDETEEEDADDEDDEDDEEEEEATTTTTTTTTTKKPTTPKKKKPKGK